MRFMTAALPRSLFARGVEGENVSILHRLGVALGLGLLGVEPLERN